MKLKKKNNSGMSLVEVVVAMSYFAFATLAATMAFAACFKVNVRNQQRDEELALQQTAVQKGTAAGVAIYNGHYKNAKISFDDATTNILTVDNVSEYYALDSAKQRATANFHLNTFSNKELASTKVTSNRDHGTYCFMVSNTSQYPADISFEISDGYLYEGEEGNGYRHSSNLYRRSLAAVIDPSEDPDVRQQRIENGDVTAPDGFELGYKYYAAGEAGYDPMSNPVDIRVSVNGYVSHITPSILQFNASANEVKFLITIHDNGASISYIPK